MSQAILLTRPNIHMPTGAPALTRWKGFENVANDGHSQYQERLSMARFLQPFTVLNHPLKLLFKSMNFKCSIKSSHSYVFFLKRENKGLAWQQKQLVHVASRLRAIRISQKSVCIKHVAIETDTLSASGLPQHHYHLI